MSAKIGKIVKYQKGVGEIISQDGKYLFTNNDISTEEDYEINDLVIFRGEKIQGTNKAFFIKKLDEKAKTSLKKVLYKKD